MGDVSAHWGWIGNIKVKDLMTITVVLNFFVAFTDDSYEGFAVERLMPLD